MVIPQTGSMTPAGDAVSCCVDISLGDAIVPLRRACVKQEAPLALLHVLRRIGLELRLTDLGAKVVGLPVVFTGGSGLGRVHLHAAHDVAFHSRLLEGAYYCLRTGVVGAPPG